MEPYPKTNSCCSLSDCVRLGGARDSGFLLDVNAGRYYKLNSTALYVCAAMRDGVHLSSLAETIVAAAGSDYPSAQVELWNFLLRLRDLGLCQIHNLDSD
jgi:hypothetical protein